MYRKDFIVEISKIRRQVVREGFGTILVVSDTMDLESTKISELSDLGKLTPPIAPDTQEYKMIKSIFEQEVKPKHIILAGIDMSQPDADITKVLDEAYKLDYSISFVVSPSLEFKSIADWVEDKEIIYFVTTIDKTIPVTLTGEHSHTVMAYSDDLGNFIAEALCSVMSTADVGSVTGKFKQLVGVIPQNITQDDLDALHKSGMITYVTKMGEDQTSEGITLSGEYIDVILSEIWIKKTMEYRLMKMALDNGKIPYDDVGIAMLVSVVNGVLQEGVANGTILTQDGTDYYSIEYVSREDTPFTDIGTRQYNGVSWEATLTGAIHGGIITGKLLLD